MSETPSLDRLIDDRERDAIAAQQRLVDRLRVSIGLRPPPPPAEDIAADFIGRSPFATRDRVRELRLAPAENRP